MLQESFEEHAAVVAASAEVLVPALERAAALTIAALDAGGTVLVLGNGGSASQAQHFAAELIGRYQLERAAAAAISLTSDQATLTAIANDYGFEQVFARQIDAYARAGDVVVAISTSGRSANVVAAAQAARAAGCTVVALTGVGGGDLASLADVLVAVPSTSTPRIQEVHALCLHAWAAAVEAHLAARGPA